MNKPLTLKAFAELKLSSVFARHETWFHKPTLQTLLVEGLVEMLGSRVQPTSDGFAALAKPLEIKLTTLQIDRLLDVRAGKITRNGNGWTDSFQSEGGTVAYPLFYDLHMAGFVDAEPNEPEGSWRKHRVFVTELGDKLLAREPSDLHRAILENVAAGRDVADGLTRDPAFSKAVGFVFRFHWVRREFHRDREHPWTEHLTDHGAAALRTVKAVKPTAPERLVLENLAANRPVSDGFNGRSHDGALEACQKHGWLRDWPFPGSGQLTDAGRSAIGV